MAKTTRSAQKLNRRADMDEALFEALASSIPPKNTGPDPDDILGDIGEDDRGDDDDSGNARVQRLENRNLVVGLDDIDTHRANKIVALVREQTGEQVDLASAIKIALSLCPLDEQKIGTAYRGIMARQCCN